MSFNLDQLFTHIDILRSREPEVVDQSTLNNNKYSLIGSLEEDEMQLNYSHCPPYSREHIRKGDFISLLTLGWKKNYNEELQFNTVHDPKDGVSDLEVELLGGRWGNCTERGRTKKLAQHKAAAKLLLKIIDSGRHKEFLIPGIDMEHARQIILSTMQELFGQEMVQQQSNPLSHIMTGPSSQQQPNWVGRVQEFIMKKRIDSKWNDEYTQISQGNTIEHNCQVVFHILDGQIPPRQLEGTGRAANKKLAKQLAFQPIFGQLVQLYGQPPSTSSIPTSASGNKQNGPAIVQEKQGTSAVPPIPEKVLEDRYALTLGPYEIMEMDANKMGEEENGREEENAERMADIGLYLGMVLSDRLENTPGSELKLRRILKWKDAQVEKLFKQAELKFIQSTKNENYDIVQVYLEVWVVAGAKKILYCTFGGEGPILEAARDDASWQAMEFLYIFGGFSPLRLDES